MYEYIDIYYIGGRCLPYWQESGCILEHVLAAMQYCCFKSTRHVPCALGPDSNPTLASHL